MRQVAVAAPPLAALVAMRASALGHMRMLLRENGIRLCTGAADDDAQSGGYAEAVGDVWVVVDGMGRPALGIAALAAHWQRQPWTMSIEVLRPHADRGGGLAMVEQARIGSRCSWSELRAQAGFTIALMLRRHLAVAPTNAGMPRPPHARGPVAGRRSGAARAVLLLPVGTARRFTQRWRDRLTEEWWSIGVLARTAAEVIAAGGTGDAVWDEPSPGGAYLADPFVWDVAQQVVCEEFPGPEGPGRLRLLRWNAAGGLQRGEVVLPSASHLSYPCVTETTEGTLLLPESGAARRTAIHRLAADGSTVEVVCVAEDRALADPTLFVAEDRFWIAYTDADIGPHDNLCLMSAADVLGPWQDDPRNPVKLDIASCRPAGAVLQLDGVLYRPSQDCSHSYGSALVFNRIESLTGGFRETSMGRLDPDPNGPFPDGLHSFAAAGSRVLIDGKRLVWRPAKPLRGLRRRLRQWIRKSGSRISREVRIGGVC